MQTFFSRTKINTDRIHKKLSAFFSRLRDKRIFISYLQSVTKYKAISKKIKQNWRRPEQFDMSFSASLDRYYQKLISGGEVGQ